MSCCLTEPSESSLRGRIYIRETEFRRMHSQTEFGNEESGEELADVSISDFSTYR
jgi:hypothetical protein